MRQHLVIIGNGMAGIRLVEEVLNLSPDRFAITVITKEACPSYNRILLSSVLQGVCAFEDIQTHPLTWYQENQVTLRLDEAVQVVDTKTKKIITNARALTYDRLVFATGSDPFILPVPGADKNGVMAFRTIKDCETILSNANTHHRAAVIGGGLLGLEAAKGLIDLGMEVDVVHLSNRIMDRQLDRKASSLLKQELEKQGMRFLLEKETEQILGEKQATGIRFRDGTEIAADLVVMAAGVRPNTKLAQESGVPTGHGILVDDRLCTDVPHVYAVGECAEHKGIIYGLVAPLYEQTKILARELCDQPGLFYRGSVVSAKLKIAGIDVFSSGDLFGDTLDEWSMHQGTKRHYKKLLFNGDCLAGACLVGNIDQSSELVELMRKKTPLSDKEKEQLLNGKGRSKQIRLMPRSDTICQCNAVSKGTIVDAMKKAALTTVEQVAIETKAGSSCGGCKSLVSELMQDVQAGRCEEVAPFIESVCACTNRSQYDLAHEIKKKKLVTFDIVASSLNWKKRDGCSVCRDSVGYYINRFFPDRAPRKQSAVEETDGTFTVAVPMIGGMWKGEQLGLLEQVVRTYQLPGVYLDETSKLQIKGIPLEQVEQVQSALDLPITTPYGKQLHVVLAQDKEGWESGKELADRLFAHFKGDMFPAEIVVSFGEQKVKRMPDMTIRETILGWECYLLSEEKEKLLFMHESTIGFYRMICVLLHSYSEKALYGERINDWIEKEGRITVLETLYASSLRNRLEVSKKKQEVVLSVH
ncbi:nitrite reductase large subunit NirB [Shouchella patagoniensis]|uniref:nitrite reductase large subunit NirB n=1 Tax=Shouchella patagoniensis TaxID=228576 RepID=UPI000995ADB7|nr:nitrite reductase large subunit NirB [Shouchella patagoniensis]